MATAPQAAARLAQDVRTRRVVLKLGQQEVAELSGTSIRFVRSLEHGKETARLDKVLAVLEALGLDLRAEVRSDA
ncbi:MAG: helix-turn-helix domain-containing protein [Actinomycetes bacterium]